MLDPQNANAHPPRHRRVDNPKHVVSIATNGHVSACALECQCAPIELFSSICVPSPEGKFSRTAAKEENAMIRDKRASLYSSPLTIFYLVHINISRRLLRGQGAA